MPGTSSNRHELHKSTLPIPGLLGLHCPDCEPLYDSSVSEESEDPDTSINKAVHDLKA